MKQLFTGSKRNAVPDFLKMAIDQQSFNKRYGLIEAVYKSMEDLIHHYEQNSRREIA